MPRVEVSLDEPCRTTIAGCSCCSFARFALSTISGNAQGGVAYGDLSMGDFVGTTVTGNGGVTDIVCNPQYSATRGVADTGGTTNCVEP